MRLQVVHCHPLTDSFDHALYETIVGTLRTNGHDVVATDLYREGFQPAMTEAERRSYMGNDYDLSAVAPYAETLKKVDGLILCFPHVVHHAGGAQGLGRSRLGTGRRLHL